MLTIRAATRVDAGAIHELVRELALYEREPNAVVATEADYARDGFGENPRFFVLLAEEANGDAKDLCGFAFYYLGYSTWEGGPVLYLEDLFVRPSHRKKGIGVALMRALSRAAIDAHCTRFEWQVLDWNTPAIGFYEKLGARIMPDWKKVRLDGDALRTLAT